jgi:site-specific DNA-methyltransferase (adenine-specific)
MINTVQNIDCLIGMQTIPDKSVDMILCDLPYGTTACKWDVIIPFDKLWQQYERIIKDNGAIVLTASQPFTSLLVVSNMKLFKYCLVWDKVSKSDVMNAKNKPLKQHEDVCIFSKGTTANCSNKKMNYFPIGVTEPNRKPIKNSTAKGRAFNPLRPSHKEVYSYQGGNYPSSLIKFSNANRLNALHPTQKPVALFEYLIKTYTNEGQTVLDNCMGSGTTAIACINTNRNYIGFEKDETYFNIIQDRIKKHTVQTELFTA